MFRLIVKDIHAVHADLDTRCVTLHHQLWQAFSQISYISSYTRTIPTQHRRSWELTGRRPTLHLSMPFRGSHPAPERMDKRLSRNLVLLSSSQHANQRCDCLDSSQHNQRTPASYKADFDIFKRHRQCPFPICTCSKRLTRDCRSPAGIRGSVFVSRLNHCWKIPSTRETKKTRGNGIFCKKQKYSRTPNHRLLVDFSPSKF